MSINSLMLRGAVLLFCLGLTDAAPSQVSQSLSPLNKRFNKLVGCSGNHETKIGTALADMANLGLHGYSEASTSNIGYNHYFQDSELDIFKSAMSTIASNNDPTNPPYQFIVNCNPTGDALKACGKKSYAFTDAAVPKDDNDLKTIWICPFFWDGPDSKQDLPDTSNKDKMDEFCKKDNYKQYVTAGHILLHEITHLDAVAKNFPLDQDDNGRHGTLDYEIGSSPIQDARRLKQRIDNGQKDLQAPIYTAESYAGAATEMWFQKFCKEDFIPPKTGY